MHTGTRSTRSKLLFLLLSLFIVDRGWVSKTYPSALIEDVALVSAAAVGIVRASLYVAAALCHAARNSNDSIFQRMYAQETQKKVDAPLPVSKPQIASVAGSRRTSPVTSITPAITPAVASFTDTAFSYPTAAEYHRNAPLSKPLMPDHEHQALFEQQAQKVVDGIAYEWDMLNERAVKPVCPAISYEAYRVNIGQDAYSKPDQWYTMQEHPDGVTYRTLDNQFYCNVGSPRHHATHKPWITTPQQQYWGERAAIQYDPVIGMQVKKHINDFIVNGACIAYGSKIEQVAALLNNAHFQIPGISYGQKLTRTQHYLYAAYFHRDGSICPSALDNRVPARKALLEYPGDRGEHVQAFQKACAFTSTTDCNNRIRKRKKVPANMADRVHNDATNKIYAKMLSAYAANDMKTVRDLYDRHYSKILVQQLYHQMQSERNAALKKQAALLKDTYGILHFNLPIEQRDPFNTHLSEQDRVQLKRNSRALKELNDLLVVRNHAKIILHKAWSIPFDTSSEVHQAMFGILECHTIPDRIDTVCAVSSDNTKSIVQQQNLVKAFFLPNGILKDFADYDRAQKFRVPNTILSGPHARTRQILNHLVYVERIALSDAQKEYAAHGITQIKAALVETDAQKSSKLLQNLHASCIVSPVNMRPISCEEAQGTKVVPASLIFALEESSDKPKPPREAIPAKPAAEAIPATPAPEAESEPESGIHTSPSLSDDVTPATMTDTFTPDKKIKKDGPGKKKDKPKPVKLPDNITPEQRTRATKAIQNYNHKQNLARCEDHGKILSKGMHEIFPEELVGIVASEEECAKMIRAYKDTMLTPSDCGPQVSVWKDYRHIYAPEILKNCETGEIVGKGFHHDYLGQANESGLIKFYDVAQGQNGTYTARWSYGNSEPKFSSFFPNEWTRIQVNDKIDEALRNLIETPELTGKTWIAIGETSEKIRITALLEGNAKGQYCPTGKMITAYPWKEIIKKCLK